MVITGPNDILENKIKKILSLLWQLVVHYQVTEANQGSKILLLEWMNATLPDKDITNFTTDWNDGINLSALVDYCKPGLIPHHPFLEPSNALENITKAMELAEQHLGIPQIMQPDDFAAEKPDEQSVMTYLSFFCSPTSPGEKRLLSWIQKQIPSKNVTNLTTDWVSGEALGMLVNEVSANAYPDYDQEMTKQNDVKNCKKHMDAAKELLGIKSTLEPEEFANPDLNPVSRATYLVQFYFAKLCPKVMDLHIPSKPGSGEMVWVDLFCPEESGETVQGSAQRSAIGRIPVEIENIAPNKYRVKFQAKTADTYTLAVYVNGNCVKGSPFRVDLNPADPTGVKLTNTILPKKAGLPVSLFFDTIGAGNGEVTAQATGKRVGQVPVHIDQTSSSECKVCFIPFEGDLYTLEVHFDGEPVRGSPFVYPLTSIAQPESVKCGTPKFSKPQNPVHLDVDVRNAGNGKLTARCTGELSGIIEVKILGEEHQPTGVTFTPPEEDVYTLSICFDDTEVNGSPFSINLYPMPPNAEKVTVLEPPSGRLNAGEEIKICFDTTEAGTGALTASCKGDNVGDVSVTVDKVSEQKHAVLFIPPEEDIYTVNVMWADSHIRGSPFTINLTPKGKPDASKCRVVSPLIMSGLTNKIFSSSNTAIYTVNREVSFEIDTADAGIGSLSVTATTQEGPAQTPFIESIPERPEVFKISYTPATPGTHTFDLLWADETLPSSPMSFEVMDATLLPFGIPVLVNMTANCRKRNLKAYAVYQGKEVQHKLKIDKLDKGRFHLTFKPKDEGIYYIHVLNEDKELPGSPLKVCCTKAIKATNKTDGNVDFVVEEGHDDELCSMTHGSSETTVGSTIPSLSAMGSAIALVSVPMSRESFTLTQMDKSPSPEEQNLTKAAGKESVQAKWGAVKGTVTGLNLEDEKFRVNVPHSFKLHCEDLGEGTPDVACKPPAGAEISMSPAPGDNSHWVNILPKKAGKHELTVKFNGKHILGSPFHVQFTTRSDASKCILEDSPPECQKMSTGAQNIIFCVSNKGAGKGKLTATAKSIATKEPVPVTITRPFKHHYHIEFDPSEGVNYILTIKYDDINIPGSPFKLALGDASKCHIEGEGIIEAWLNEENRFTVNAKEAGPGQLNVSVEGDDENVEPDISTLAEGTFEVAYHPTRCALYSVSVKWGNQGIPGSPFEVRCRRRILASEIHIPDLSAGAYIGKPLKLTLVAEGIEIEQEERFTGFVRSSDGEEFSLQLEKGDSGSCICTIDPPPTVGVYEFHVLWMGEHITRSPFDLEVVSPPKLDDFTVKAVEAEGGVIALEVLGPKYAFRCGELKASVENAVTMDKVPVTATQLSHQEYNIEFKPGKCGEYLLSITYDDNHIQGSPFRLIATDASLCYTKGKGLTAAQFGEENKFVVCTENAGSGELFVDVEGQEGNMELFISATSENRYDITYNPPKLGMYQISVKWGDQHIPGSPFEVLCVNAARYSVVKPPKELTLGKVMKVGVKVADDAAPDWEKLEIVARLKDNRSFKGEVKKGDDGNYICTVTPPELGKYQVHVRCNGLDIPGSPFRIKVLEAPIPENVKAYGEGLENGTIGQERRFNIELKNAGYGYLGFRVQGPKKGFKISMDRSEEEEDIIYARYTPIYTGDYTISVLWSGVHVSGSPFFVNITESEEQDSESG